MILYEAGRIIIRSNSKQYEGRWSIDSNNEICATMNNESKSSCWKYRLGKDNFIYIDYSSENSQNVAAITKITNYSTDEIVKRYYDTKNAIEESQKPDGILRVSYEYYILAKRCFESRREYKAVYMTETQINEVKSNIKYIESHIKNISSNINTSEIWNKADSNMKIWDIGHNWSEEIKSLCDFSIAQLKSTRSKYDPQSMKTQKDF